MQQNEMSLETYAAQFCNCAARIAASKVGTPVDSATQATNFLKGLKRLIVYKLQGMAKGQNQEQPQNERPHGQANYVDRNRGGNRFRPATYSTHGRGHGAALNAVQALPPQEVQFNVAQARDKRHPANNWAMTNATIVARQVIDGGSAQAYLNNTCQHPGHGVALVGAGQRQRGMAGKNKADIMFSTDSLHTGCAQSDGQKYE
ncbi:TPA: hypothetical protein ACH3X2_003767 [Trebouxia sp. C0005]